MAPPGSPLALEASPPPPPARQGLPHGWFGQNRRAAGMRAWPASELGPWGRGVRAPSAAWTRRLPYALAPGWSWADGRKWRAWGEKGVGVPNPPAILLSSDVRDRFLPART
jgi:hypothetical protein